MEKNMITQSALNIWNLVTYYLSPEAGKPHKDKVSHPTEDTQ